APSVFVSETPSVIQSLGAEEVVPPLDLVRGVREVAVPRGVVADALREAATVADRALLDVADLSGDARQVPRGAGPSVPEGVLVGLERDPACRVGGAVLLDPAQERVAVADVVALAHDRGAEPPLVLPVDVVVA